MEHFYYPSQGRGQLHGCRWLPDGEVRGIVQIVHGIAEYVERYDEFARYLNGLGYLVVAEDHMGHGGSVGESETKGYFHGGENGKISIVDNIFETFDIPILYAKSVNGLIFKNNKILKNTEYEPYHWNKKTILLERVTNATIKE